MDAYARQEAIRVAEEQERDWSYQKQIEAKAEAEA
jgi:hypothetical protein